MNILPLLKLRHAVAGCLLICLPAVAASEEIPSARQAELLYLLKHDCGACHGMRLNGGLGPALDAVGVRDWSVEQLTLTILYGRPGTPMPPWRPFLSDQEARWLAQNLKQGIRP